MKGSEQKTRSGFGHAVLGVHTLGCIFLGSKRQCFDFLLNIQTADQGPSRTGCSCAAPQWPKGQKLSTGTCQKWGWHCTLQALFQAPTTWPVFQGALKAPAINAK